jgi:hypothetical protein
VGERRGALLKRCSSGELALVIILIDCVLSANCVWSGQNSGNVTRLAGLLLWHLIWRRRLQRERLVEEATLLLLLGQLLRLHVHKVNY